jgi:hypothetical protein
MHLRACNNQHAAAGCVYNTTRQGLCPLHGAWNSHTPIRHASGYSITRHSKKKKQWITLMIYANTPSLMTTQDKYMSHE